MNITLRQLRVFEAAARHLNFTRAAEELFLTQPAVSMQIKQLEQQVGEPLFDQLGKQIQLTETGREVYRYSVAIANQIDELRMVLEERHGLQTGRLQLTAASTANYFVPTLLGVFNRRHAGITVNIEITNRENLLKALTSNTTDFAIMGQPPESAQDIEAHAFLDNPLLVLAPPDHPLAGERAISLERLSTETFIARERGSGTRAAHERFFAQHGMTAFPLCMEMNSNEAIKQAVQAGLGVSVLSVHTVEVELLLERLVILDVQGFPIMRQWHIVHRRGKRFSAVADAFREFVLSEARNLIQVPSAA